MKKTQTDPVEQEQQTASYDNLGSHLSDDDIKEISKAVTTQDSDTVNAFLEDLNPADTAELIAKVNEEERQELIAMYRESLDPEVFTEMAPELRKTTLDNMPTTEVVQIISDLQSDDALDLVENLSAEQQEKIIKKLSTKTRRALKEGLSFPEDSAGRLMQREFVAIPQFWTAGKTVDYLRTTKEDVPEDFFDIFVVTPTYHVIGAISLNKLIRAESSTSIENITDDDIHAIPADMDQEEVAMLFRREDLVSAPVMDDHGRLIGVVTIDDVIDVIDEEAGEDILRMAGVDQGDIYKAILSTTGTRFRWLFINLLTAIMASIVISFFDATLEQIIALAVLMPIVASMGGNAGTQALTVAVRALATKELSEANTWRIIWKETVVGTLNGVLFAGITGITAGLWFQDTVLGIVIAAAMVINLIIAGLCGASIPILLDRVGSDPAISSTVLLTTITDIVGFFAFLGLAAIFMV